MSALGRKQTLSIATEKRVDLLTEDKTIRLYAHNALQVYVLAM